MNGPRTLIVGAGLMGTSMGLALRRAGWPVWLQDSDSRSAALAADLGAGDLLPPQGSPELVILAIPQSSTLLVSIEMNRLYPQATISDLASVKAKLQAEVETNETLRRVFVGGHPLAGRERSGAGAARADLFEGRPWVITAAEDVGRDHVEVVLSAVRACGADPVLMHARLHDEAVALVSHAPQVVASSMAAQLTGGDPQSLRLSGQGLRDTVRVAASDPDLWQEILEQNAAAVSAVLRGVVDDLTAVVAALDTLGKSTDSQVDKLVNDRAQVRDLLERGRVGHGRIPGKHGTAHVEYATVPVVIPDRPGALAALFLAAGEANVNVEDVHIEHSPGQPVGLVELAVNPSAAVSLTTHLKQAGWSVH
ncbi:MAG: prephenate dehydrogenase [Actinomycetes bacterium]